MTSWCVCECRTGGELKCPDVGCHPIETRTSSRETLGRDTVDEMVDAGSEPHLRIEREKDDRQNVITILHSID